MQNGNDSFVYTSDSFSFAQTHWYFFVGLDSMFMWEWRCIHCFAFLKKKLVCLLVELMFFYLFFCRREGSNLTPAHHYSDFRFKTYAPIAFRYFRELFGIQPDDFLVSATRINSLWPSDAIWQYRSGSTLAQVMACCLTASSHYLNQCWLTLKSKDQ